MATLTRTIILWDDAAGGGGGVPVDYAGQNTITTVGTITVGTWNGTPVGLAYGGTGANLSDPGADRIMFWDDSAGQVTWLTLGTNLTITGTTLDATGGISEPLTNLSFTDQTTMSAAASGQTDVNSQALPGFPGLLLRSSIGDFASILPAARQMPGGFVLEWDGGNLRVYNTSGTNTGTVTAGTGAAGIPAYRNFATAAATGTATSFAGSTSFLRPDASSDYFSGFAIIFPIVYFPDASYGTTTTSFIFSIGAMDAWDSDAADTTNRIGTAAGGAIIQYNGSLSDTNFQLVVRNAGGQTVTDTGIPFTAQNAYRFMLVCPRGSSNTYARVVDLTAGTSAVVSAARLPDRFDNRPGMYLMTRDNVARNFRANIIQGWSGGGA